MTIAVGGVSTASMQVSYRYLYTSVESVTLADVCAGIKKLFS